MGAPITAYNRISSERINIHSNIYEPDFVAVVDDTLLDVVPVTAGLKANGALIVNSQKTNDEIKAKLAEYSGRVYKIDARTISEDALGKYFPNTPMLGAVVKVSGVMDVDNFLLEMETSFKHKFASKPGVIEGNMKALKRSVNEVEEII